MFFKPFHLLGIALIAGLGLSMSPCEAAETTLRSTHEVSDARIKKLEKMHNDAEALILTSNFDEAIQKYNDILIYEPDDETAYVNMGNAYMILGNFMKAENAFSNALHINPDNASAQAGLQKINDPDGPPAEEAPLNLSLRKKES